MLALDQFMQGGIFGVAAMTFFTLLLSYICGRGGRRR